MNRRKGFVFFGVGMVSTALFVAAGGACQSSDTTGGGGSGGSSSGLGGTASTVGTTTNAGGAGTGASTSSSPTGTSTSTSTSSNSGGSGGGSGCVGMMDSTITDISSGKQGPGYYVTIKGAVAMSTKWLVSQSKTNGSCLWGTMFSEPGLTTTAANSGVMAVSYGTDATTNDAGKAYCPTPPIDMAGDAFPDDIKPGDTFDLIAQAETYSPTACPAAAGVQMRVCKATKTGTATPPAPAVLSTADATNLAKNDPATFAKWAGVYVEVDNESSVAQPQCTSCAMGVGTMCSPTAKSVVDGCGRIVLAGSGLHVVDDLYYEGLLNAIGVTCNSKPDFLAETNGVEAFTKVRGFGYLDYCTWSIAPQAKCTDFSPPSEDCTPTCVECKTGTSNGVCGTETGSGGSGGSN